MKTSIRSASPRLFALVALTSASLFTGCAMPVGGESELAELGENAQPVQNGEALPSALNGGVVQVKIEWAPGMKEAFSRIQRVNIDELPPYERCSGQVVSRDTILTAAHCFENVGYFQDTTGAYTGPGSRTAKVTIYHQNSDGTWEAVSGSKESITLRVPSPYFYYAQDGEPKLKDGYDMAFVQRATDWSNTGIADRTAIAIDTADRPDWLYLYGHGYHSDTSYDGQLRRGQMSRLTWYATEAGTYSHTVASAPFEGGAYSCAGDSGGPWKVPAQTTLVSGVQFGIHREGQGSGKCTETAARAVWTAPQKFWIELLIENGRGTCSTGTYSIRANNALTWKVTDTLTCW
jgi:hypothetical protein